MNRILTSTEMYLCDRTEIENHTPSRELMYRAARACADAIRALLQTAKSPADTAPVLFLCGGGNNGGDGFLCAKLLCEDGIAAVICPAFTEETHLSEECRYRYHEARAANIPMITVTELMMQAADRADAPVSHCMIVDALLGIGMTGEPSGLCAACIDAANRYARAHNTPTVAIDIASGIFADTGKICTHTFRADHTLAINNAKRGHLLYPGAAYTGHLTVLDIGIPETPLDTADHFPVYALTDDDVRALLPARLPDSNKGTNGRILIAAGSKNMCGAAYLSALAAYRTGAGLVEIFTCEDNRIPLQTRLPEAILTVYAPEDTASACERLKTSLSRASAVVIGPGLGTSTCAAALVHTVLAETTVPTVLDADALNIIASLYQPPVDACEECSPTEKATLLSIRPRTTASPLILTPHPGELSRLTGKPVPALLDDLIGHAQAFANRYGVVLNAKDTRSVITDGTRAYLNTTGTSALAKGGSGDVLSGITATLAAQIRDADGSCDALTAAALAAHLHGRAAELVTARMGARSPLASEIADALGEVFLELTGE